MKIGILFHHNSATVAVYGGSGKKTTVKRIGEIPLGDECIVDGAIRDLDMVADRLMRGMKQNRIKPTQIAFGVRNRDILFSELTVPMGDKKYRRQAISVETAKAFQGLEATRAFCYKDYDINEERKQLLFSVASVSKELVSNYVELAKRLHCRVIKMVPYQDVVTKACRAISSYSDENFLLIDVDTALQVTYWSEGAIRFSNTFSLPTSTLSGQISEMDRITLVDTIVHSVRSSTASIPEGGFKSIFLKVSEGRRFFKDSDLHATLDEIGHKGYRFVDFNENPNLARTALMSGLMQQDIVIEQDYNFLDGITIKDNHNYGTLELVLATAGGVGVSAVAALCILAGLKMMETSELDAQVQENKLFVQTNATYKQMKDEHDALELQYQYVTSILKVIDGAQQDFRIPWGTLNGAARSAGGTITSVTFMNSGALSIMANTPSYSRAADLMDTLESVGCRNVVLVDATIPKDGKVEVALTCYMTRDMFSTATMEEPAETEGETAEETTTGE